MVFYVDFSEKGKSDLRDTVKHICDELCSPQAAKRFHENVDKKIAFISENPFMYPLSRNERLAKKGYRCAVIGNYSLLYVVDEKKKTATIMRIIHGMRDLTAIDT